MRMDGDFAHLASLAGEYLGALKVHAGDSEFGSGEAGKPKLLVASGYGGNIALEMATQLKELGVANTRVLLLDTAFPKKRSSLRLGRSGTSQAASELPPTYAALSDAERIAWLSHRMGAIPGHVSAIVSEGFRAATLKAGLRCELPQLRPVLCSGENFVEVPDKILASLKSEFFQESR
jgi:hypothetical protein